MDIAVTEMIKSGRSIRSKEYGICHMYFYRCCMKLHKNYNLKTGNRPYRKLLDSQQENILRDYGLLTFVMTFRVEIWQVLRMCALHNKLKFVQILRKIETAGKD
jgi:hypothetical protein